MQIRAWSMTDVGCVRRQNEDKCYIYADDERTIGIVCDGMGGANAGEVASAMAADIFARTLLEGGHPPEERLGLEQANQEVYRYSVTHAECRGMGTTMVAVLILGLDAYILNVGDSRCYCVSAGSIRQMTQDHSLVEELVRAGTITPEQAKTHPQRNIITRAIGTERRIAGDLFIHRIRPGEQLLLCSDGLCNELTDRELLFGITDGPVEHACQRLVSAALGKGARDNVSVVVIDLQDGTEQ